MRACLKSILKKAQSCLTGAGKFLAERPAYVWLLFVLGGGVFCALSFFASDAETPLRGLLFFDHSDVGMDHFNSLLATAERTPYTVHRITYPPLAAMLYYFFYSLLDKRFVAEVIAGNASFSARDLRHQSSAVTPYILFTLVSLLLIAFAVRHALKVSEGEKTAAILGVVFSCGMISAVDRGNNVPFILGLILFYVLFYDSPNKLLSELALIALALATGLKLYPVVFGVLLIRKHKYWQGFRAVGYILIALFLPFFFFEGVEAIRIWAGHLLFSKVKYIHPGALNLDSILCNLDRALGLKVPGLVSSLFTVFYVFVGLLGAVAYKEDYKAVAFCSFAIIGFAGVSPKYTILLTCLPLLLLLEHGVRKWDWLYFSLLLLLNMPLVLKQTELLEKAGLCGVDVFESILVAVMLIALPVEGLIHLIAYLRSGQWRHLLKTEKQMARLARAAEDGAQDGAPVAADE
jgi:hypothetical protein